MTRGSGVPRPITGASEAVPGLTASASMFTVVWHTSEKKEKVQITITHLNACQTNVKC